MNKTSFTTRLALSNLMVVIVILPLFAIALETTFSSQAKLSQQQTMQAFSYELMAQIDVQNGAFVDSVGLTAPQFSTPNSGLYAAIQDQTGFIWTSPSWLGAPLTTQTFSPSAPGEVLFEEREVDAQTLFNWQIQIIFETEGREYPFVLHVIKSTEEFEQQMTSFRQLFWPWLIALSIVFVLLQIVWIWWFKRPISSLVKEVHAIESGQQNNIRGEYPGELRAFNERLNRLLLNEKQQRDRFKNRLADLAHGLKTPLALLRTREELSEQSRQDIDKIDTIINHQLKKAQGTKLGWHRGISAAKVIAQISAGLEKLHRDKSLRIHYDIDEKALFYGDEEDFFELAGNLLDNAAKACKHDLYITLKQDNGLLMSVADDGAGITDDQEKLILQRGHRADTYAQGQGIGLSIVQDIVQSYAGKLTIEGKSERGGACFTVRFPSP